MTTTLSIPLDADHVAAVHALRRRLGASDDAAPAILHLSVVVVLGAHDPSTLEDAADRIASRVEPFRIRARDLGVFLDESPVLHVPVVRSPALARLHEALFDAVVDRGFVVEGRSHPDGWAPHITIWRDTLTPQLVGDAVTRYVSGPPVAWTIRADRLACLDDVGLTSERRLGMSPCHA